MAASVNDVGNVQCHQYQYVTKEAADEPIFLTTQSAIKSLLFKQDCHFTEYDQDLSIYLGLGMHVSFISHVSKRTAHLSSGILLLILKVGNTM